MVDYFSEVPPIGNVFLHDLKVVPEFADSVGREGGFEDWLKS